MLATLTTYFLAREVSYDLCRFFQVSADPFFSFFLFAQHLIRTLAAGQSRALQQWGGCSMMPTCFSKICAHGVPNSEGKKWTLVSLPSTVQNVLIMSLLTF